MPTYNFVCETCESQWELTQSINDQLPDTCPQCGGTEEDGVFHQIYSGENFCFCRQEPTTVGQQAEINARRVGKEQIELMAEKSKPANHKGEFSRKFKGGTKTTERYKASRPWWRPHSDKPLDVKKLKDPTKYILTGKDN